MSGIQSTAVAASAAKAILFRMIINDLSPTPTPLNNSVFSTGYIIVHVVVLPTLTPFPFTPSMNENTRTKDFALVNCIFSGLPAPFPPQEQCLVFDEKSFILQDNLQDSRLKSTKVGVHSWQSVPPQWSISRRIKCELHWMP